MASVEEIVRGIHQAALLGVDESYLDEKGKPLKIGLAREEGDVVLDPRVMDGFKVQTGGNMLRLTYTSETTLDEVKDPRFEDDQISRIDDIIKFLKKEYKAIVGETLSLTMEDEPHVNVEHQNRYRTQTTVTCLYEIGGIDKQDEKGEAEKRLEKSFQQWINNGKK